MSELEGKVALVTGATQAMGEAIARRLAEQGAAIVGVGRSEQRGRAVADRLTHAGHRADFISTDVSDEAAVARAVDFAVQQFGRLDIIVNNAASFDAETAEAPVHLESTEVFDSVMKINLYGPFWFAKYGTPVMMAGGRGGLIVNISSYSAQRAVGSLPAYTASKGALEALTRQLAADYAEYGIRANVLQLGSMSVPRNVHLHQNDAMAGALRSGRMIHRFGNPEDTAAAVAFLASEGAGFITGAVIPIDGGLTAKAPVARVAEEQRNLAATATATGE